jgi:phosphoglycolate phosphatase
VYRVIAEAIIFDLDGTLLDTLKDIADCANETLSGLGFPDHPPEDYKAYIGSGVEVLFRRALPEEASGDERVVAEAVRLFRRFYGERWDASTLPYPGIAELLEQLVTHEVRLAVLTNKPHDFACKCVERLLQPWHFDAVIGLAEGLAPKPDPAGALRIAGLLRTDPAQVVFVGDSGIDMRTARAAGMIAAGALWGFRPREELTEHGADWLLARPTDLLERLQIPSAGA